MNIPITPNSVNYDDLKAKLEAQFPDYSFDMRGKSFLVCKKSGTVGANIVIRKNKIMVAGNFPSMGATFVFMLCVLLLGFLIPIIVYFAAFHSKMKKLENEIGNYLKGEVQEVV